MKQLEWSVRGAMEEEEGEWWWWVNMVERKNCGVYIWKRKGDKSRKRTLQSRKREAKTRFLSFWGEIVGWLGFA